MAETTEGVMGEFAYLIPVEKFVYKRGGYWNLSEPVGKEGIKNHLLEMGLSEAESTVLLKQREYLRVYGADLVPNQPPIFASDDGKLYLNTWVPPSIQPKPGVHPRIDAIMGWLTREDAAGIHWLLHWMAAKVQNPELTPKVAIVFSTEPGGGKGTVALVMRHLLGMENTATIKREELENKFNARWVGKLFVLADEVISNENVRDISNLLKILIDGNELEIEGKGKDQKAIRNRLAWMFASNDRISPVALDEYDRRYTFFSNHDPLTLEYDGLVKGCYHMSYPTPEFREEMAALYHELLQLKVDWSLISRPYQNEARKLLIEANKPTHEQFCAEVDDHGIDDLLEHIVVHSDFGLQKTRSEWDFGINGVSTQVLYRCYVEFCKRTGARPLKVNKFGVALRNHRPEWPFARNLVPGTKDRRINCYVVTRATKENK